LSFIFLADNINSNEINGLTLKSDRLPERVNDAALQTAIMGAPGDESAWNFWVKRQLPEFEIVRELCDGSKHFTDRATIRATHRAGWDSRVFY